MAIMLILDTSDPKGLGEFFIEQFTGGTRPLWLMFDRGTITPSIFIEDALRYLTTDELLQEVRRRLEGGSRGSHWNDPTINSIID